MPMPHPWPRAPRAAISVVRSRGPGARSWGEGTPYARRAALSLSPAGEATVPPSKHVSPSNRSLTDSQVPARAPRRAVDGGATAGK